MYVCVDVWSPIYFISSSKWFFCLGYYSLLLLLLMLLHDHDHDHDHDKMKWSSIIIINERYSSFWKTKTILDREEETNGILYHSISIHLLGWRRISWTREKTNEPVARYFFHLLGRTTIYPGTGRRRVEEYHSMMMLMMHLGRGRESWTGKRRRHLHKMTASYMLFLEGWIAFTQVSTTATKNQFLPHHYHPSLESEYSNTSYIFPLILLFFSFLVPNNNIITSYRTIIK